MSDFDATDLTADLNDILGGFSQSVQFFKSKAKGKQPFTCAAAIGEASNHTTGSDEGLIGEDMVMLTCLTSRLAWIPSDGDTCVIDGVTYRVRAARHVPGDVAYNFDCEAVNKA